MCRGFSQMIRTRPCLRMIWHFSQRFLTDDCTFIALIPVYLNRYVMRPRFRSYGESSTSTRSPGTILM